VPGTPNKNRKETTAMKRLLLVIALLLVPLSAAAQYTLPRVIGSGYVPAAAPAFRQVFCSNSNGTVGTTLTCVFGSNVSAGDEIAFDFVWDSSTVAFSSATSTCTTGNFTLVNNPTLVTAGANQQAQGYAEATSTGACTITATLASSVSSAAGIFGVDIENLRNHVLDKNALNAQTTPGTGAGAVTSGSVTTTAADFCVGLAMSTGGNTPTVTAVSPFVGSGSNYEGSQVVGYVAGYAQSAAGAVAATFTTSVSFTDWGTGILCFN
jgi:hypothetical protein